MFVGQVNIVCHSSCRTSAILKYFCPLTKALVGPGMHKLGLANRRENADR